MENETEQGKGFVKGAPLWKQRAKVGRDMLFASPEVLWDACCEYFHWVDTNDLMAHEWKVVDKELKAVSVPRARPYTMGALCIFLDVNEAYFRNWKYHNKEEENESEETRILREAFSTVITKVEAIVYQQKFEGAAAGYFKENLISRDLGLADKREVKADVNLSDLPLTFE